MVHIFNYTELQLQMIAKTAQKIKRHCFGVFLAQDTEVD